jgi:hypothetical protein
MFNYYKLEGKSIVKCRDMMEWATWFETADRHVTLEVIGGVRISTVFLGLDHSFSFTNETRPVLFETMVFVGRDSLEEYMDRYCTYEEAEAGHKAIVENIKRHPWSLIVLPWLKFTWYRIILPRMQIVINKVWALGNKIKSRLP